MKAEHLEILTAHAEERTFGAGEILFRQGEPANQFFLLQGGSVVLEASEPTEGSVPVQTLGAGEVVGWSWLFAPFSWHLEARALEETPAIVISGAHLLIMAERDHEFGYDLMKRVAQLAIQRLQAVRKQLLAHPAEFAAHS